MRRRALLAAAASIPLLHAPAASAATTVSTSYEGRFGTTTVTATASPRNDRVHVGGDSRHGEVTIADSRGVNTSDPDCESLSRTVVACDVDPDKVIVSTLSGDDRITFGPGADSIFYEYGRGGDGDDTLIVRGGNSSGYLDGGEGDDRLRGGGGVDYLYGFTGRDVLVGQASNDSLWGGNGGDVLTGGPEYDELDGGNGPDVLHSADGLTDQELDCGTGRDRLVHDRSDPSSVSCERRTIRGYHGDRAALSDLGPDSTAGYDAAASGASFHGVTMQRELTDRDIARMRYAGVGTVRFQISWQATEPRPGVFDWSTTDRLLREIGEAGASPLPFFEGAPDWLATDSTDDPMSTLRARVAWRDFVIALLKRYGPDGTFTEAEPDAARVRTWQLWNEPNLNGHWGGGPDPVSYASMVVIASGEIRARDPDAEIMLAGLAPAARGIKPWTFMQQLLPELPDDSFDTAAIHPYAEDLRGADEQIERVRAAMSAYGEGATPLAVTEIGWGSSREAVTTLAGTPRTQAELLTKMYRRFAHRRAYRISEVLWYALRDLPQEADGCGFCSSSGLLRADGDAKPAWTAFKRSMSAG
ncbi:MAG: beta-galactosidase [Solirubrobacterales bacterium]